MNESIENDTDRRSCVNAQNDIKAALGYLGRADYLLRDEQDRFVADALREFDGIERNLRDAFEKIGFVGERFGKGDISGGEMATDAINQDRGFMP